MKKMFLVMSLFLSQASFGMDFDRIEKIHPDKDTIEQLKQFHEPTSSGEYSPKPGPEDIKPHKKVGRCLIAKMDSFGLDRYFSFETSKDVNTLVKAVQDGGGMEVEWFYYDLQPKNFEGIEILSLEEWEAKGKDK